MDGLIFCTYLNAAIPPVSFLLILWCLLAPKYSRRVTLTAALGFFAAEGIALSALFLLGCDLEYVAGLLPLILYLPAILCFHLLSDKRVFFTALAWLLALLCDQSLAILRKLLIHLVSLRFQGPADWVIPTVLLLMAAALLLLLVFRFLRRPFHAYTQEQISDRPTLLLLPAALLTLYSYFLSSTTDITVTLLLLFTTLAALLVLGQLIVSLNSERQVREAKRQMEALRLDYELLQKKLELGRGYRHDMRHHIAALGALLQQEDTEGARKYVAEWQGQLTAIEAETWCRNSAVNGVLSAYLAQARDVGCELEADVALPEALPFDNMDLCVVLANALENALHACERLPEGTRRYIRLSVTLTDQRRFTVCVENPCPTPLTFDEKGFPIVPRREGHGQGLKSIAAVAEKYCGVFQCSCSDGLFALRVVLLSGAPRPRPFRRAEMVFAGAVLVFLLINSTPSLAQALETIPVLGPAIRVVDLRSYSWSWGDSGVSVQEPELEGSGSAVDRLEAQTDEFISQMEEEFSWYAARKYQGYVAEDISYDLIRDDGELLILRFYATINVGGSVNFTRCFVLDQETGRILELSDLFLPDSNYIFPISREIQAQMAEQIAADEGMYFLSGGIWPEEDCFKSIEPDQNFYINDDGELVIVFDEYSVAPGSMGTPEFVIPTGLLGGLLAQPSVLA